MTETTEMTEMTEHIVAERIPTRFAQADAAAADAPRRRVPSGARP